MSSLLRPLQCLIFCINTHVNNCVNHECLFYTVINKSGGQGDLRDSTTFPMTPRTDPWFDARPLVSDFSDKFGFHYAQTPIIAAPD